MGDVQKSLYNIFDTFACVLQLFSNGLIHVLAVRLSSCRGTLRKGNSAF